MFDIWKKYIKDVTSVVSQAAANSVERLLKRFSTKTGKGKSSKGLSKKGKKKKSPNSSVTASASGTTSSGVSASGTTSSGVTVSTSGTIVVRKKTLASNLSFTQVPLKVLSKIESACEKIMREKTPNLSTGLKWKVNAEPLGPRAIALSLGTKAVRGEKIYASLLLGSRTKPWRIKPRRKQFLSFKVNRIIYSAYDKTNFSGLEEVVRRRAHYDGTKPTKSTSGPWIHPNFIGLKVEIRITAESILELHGYGGIVIDLSGFTHESFT